VNLKTLTALNAFREARALALHAAIMCARSKQMLDLILLAGAVAAFVLSIGYAYACDRL